MRANAVSRSNTPPEPLSCSTLFRECSLVLGLSAVLGLGCWGGSDPEKLRGGPQIRFPEPPNVILIVVDTLRRDHVGVYGYPRPTTPFLDELAAQGVVFENAYSQAPQTFNSTVTLLTSRYFPYLVRNTQFESVPGLDEESQARHAQVPYLAKMNLTLPEVLGEGGYETLGVFTNPHHHATSGFWQGFEKTEYLTPESRAVAYARGPKIHQAFFEWLDQRRTDRPYFAYLHFMDVHAPYRPPHKLRKLFVTVPGRDRYRKGKPTGDQIPSAEDLAYMQALYDG
ncbi:MAG: sulfatase-like hydrolase/transferase, partial [bacterium]|nr:sulfatase-like hydrolase/transferase [bacterium]